MWTASAPNRASRTPSVHSVASNYSASQRKSMITSLEQKQSRGYDSDQASDSTLEDDRSLMGPDSSIPAIWKASLDKSAPVVSLINQKLGNDHAGISNVLPTPVGDKSHHDDDSASQASTMDGAEEDFVRSKGVGKSLATVKVQGIPREPSSPAPAPYVPGPLESQLAALMSKLIYIEQKQPTVSIQPEEYQEMQARLKALEEEKKTWSKRYEALWQLRDEDVENNIKIRGLLAKTRRELEATQKLREEDLANVSIVRGKLAEKAREFDQLQSQSQAGRSSPGRRRPTSYIQRFDTTDLFTAAKVAALEQRTLELEKRNTDLVAQLETAKGSSNIDDLNRTTAHKAWKDEVANLEAKLKAKDAELARTRSSSSSSGATSSSATAPSMDWYKIEALLEEHSNYRESVGGKLQALRSEKETLQRDLHRKENECQAMELKVQNLQRRAHIL